MVPGFAKYRSHKLVEAARIVGAEFEADGSGKVAIRAGEGQPNIIPVPMGFHRKPGDLLAAIEGGGAVLVRYPDGYLSWSPMQPFLDGYTAEPKDWRERLIRERDELAERLYKLRQFLMGPNAANLPAEQFELMKGQQYRMGQYCAILDARIKASAA